MTWMITYGGRLRRGCRSVLCLSLGALLLLSIIPLMARVASAHEVRPAIASVTLGDPIVVALDVNAEALLAGIGAEHDDTDDSPAASRYDALRASGAAELTAEIEAFMPRLLNGITLSLDDIVVPLSLAGIDVPPVGDVDLARESTITLNGPGRSGATLEWVFDETFGASVLRMQREDKETVFHSAYAQPGDVVTVPLALDAPPQAWWVVFADYVVVGFEHIIPKGLDHILFVIGLFLLSTRTGPLLWQVTAFTIAHTITLALAMTGTVSVAPSIVEPLIAASIALIAVENILTQRLHPWRPLMVFVFGLLHGLGFAGVLGDIGLPPGHFVTGLVAFNIGVELGQLTVIAACFLAVGFWFSGRDWYRRAIVIPASAAIAAVAMVWVLERTGVIG